MLILRATKAGAPNPAQPGMERNPFFNPEDTEDAAWSWPEWSAQPTIRLKPLMSV